MYKYIKKMHVYSTNKKKKLAISWTHVDLRLQAVKRILTASCSAKAELILRKFYF